MSEYTARTWLRKGRREPAGRYGAFALAVAAGREAAEVSMPDRQAPLTVEEVMAHLAKSIRAGSVTAMKVWLDRHDREHLGVTAGDELAVFDELAKRRRASG